MNRYTFTGAAGFKTVVIASNEADARHIAMCQRWGNLPDGKVTIHHKHQQEAGKPFRYEGRGLSVTVEENVRVPSPKTNTRRNTRPAQST